MSGLVKMILSGEVLGCSQCEDVAFDCYNELNRLKDTMNWYLECDSLLEWAAAMLDDDAYDEYIHIVEYAEDRLMELLK